MPILKSAKKALKQDIRNHAANEIVRKALRGAVKTVQEKPTPGTLKKAYSAIDRAVKQNLMHKNRAARMKSQLSKLSSKPHLKTKSRSKAKPRLKRQKPTS
ncbi:30S ribosomal protein S20 [Candidatus Woesebacteria bacterium]|nr:30S ribosomal protein S20 [Candidatus Woesebacteria bacterium]|tara:strand:- start:483 stop:785 length:303 start_codon:yes stop_codon:yes gene_type:complete